MDIDLLRTFVAICEARSFTAAARHVGRTQSAVSLQMRRLEESLGRPLFFRGASAVTLTEHGELLQGHAREILAGVDQAMAAFDRSSPAGIVVIGLPEDYAPRVLPFLLDSARSLLPHVTVDLVLAESKALARQVAEGSVDLALITEGEGPVRGGPVVLRDRIIWVGPAAGDLHLRDPVPVAVWNDDDSYSRAIFGAFARIGRRYSIAVVSQSVRGLQAAVCSGHAVTALVSSSLVAGMRELGEAEGYPPLPGLSIRLERAQRRRSAVVDRLEAHLIACFRGFEAPAGTPAAIASVPSGEANSPRYPHD